MRFSKFNVLKSFEGSDQRVLDFLEYILDELKAKEKALNNYTLVILQLLSAQLNLYFKAQDEVCSNVTEVSDTKYGKVKKIKPEVQIMMSAHKEVTRLLDKLGLSPLEKAKIKRMNTTEQNSQADGTELLAALIN